MDADRITAHQHLLSNMSLSVLVKKIPGSIDTMMKNKRMHLAKIKNKLNRLINRVNGAPNVIFMLMTV